MGGSEAVTSPSLSGICEPAASLRGEGVHKPADEEQLLLQEPETREGRRQAPASVDRAECSV